MKAPPTPLALLPEFSDSRDEPAGPANVATPAVIEIHRRPGSYLAAMHAIADAWGKREFEALPSITIDAR